MSRLVDFIRRQFFDARRAKRGGLVLLALAVFTLFGTSAWAYWTTTGQGTASASTATLNAPTNVLVPSTSSTGSVIVNWTGSSGVLVPQGYYVTRVLNSNNSTALACGTSATALAAAPSCTDLGVPGGTFHYIVTAVYNSWMASSSASNPVSVNTVLTATKLAFNTGPSATATSAVSFALQPAVAIQDAGGNTVTADTTSVTLALTAPGGATLACTANTKAAVAGVASFSGCQIDKAGTYTLTATDGALASSLSTSVTINPGVAAVVATLAGSSQSATVNAVFATTLAAKVADSFGNAVPGVSVSFTAPGTSASGKFANTTVTTSAITNASGVATATTFTATTTSGSYTVSAAAAGATSASFALTNNPGVAATMVFSQQPTGGDRKSPIAPAVTVRILDQFGNQTVSAAPVTLVLNTAPNGGKLSGTLAVAAVNGLADFSDLTVNKAGTYSLDANSNGMTVATSSNFTMT